MFTIHPEFMKNSMEHMHGNNYTNSTD